jgi:two-component system, OmpR family, sensor histidine kinase KdpD
MNRAGQRRFGVEGPRVLTGYVIALAGTAVVTGGLLAVRGRVTATNVALAYLLVVVAAAANGGLWPGVTAAGLGFVAFDLLFLPPYGHLKVHNQQDYVSLAVYLLIALVVSVLVEARERRRAQAERREHETRTLYELSNSLLGHDSLQATLQRVAATVRSLFDLGGCAIVLPSGSAPGGVVAASDGQLPEQLPALLHSAPDGEMRLREPPSGDPGRISILVVPMRTAQRPVGAMVLVASGRQPAGFGEVERRLLTTFATQAALAVDHGQGEQERAHAQALVETDRLRSALLNSVSHDLRTPLASIKASASSLLDPDVAWNPSEQREFLDTIDQESDRLSRLVHNLLDMSRIEAGALDPHLTETTLAEVVGPVVRRARAQTSQQLLVEIPEDLPTVLVDPVRLDQVFTNLVDNAGRYAGDQPVTLAGRTVDGRVELRVIDHGPGIPAAERERVFDQFYRLRRNGHRPDGTGMGLAVCRGIVSALGGQIHVQATPGGGATFVVSLPPADQRSP